MAGYKVLLRTLAVIIILGLVGFGIYYVVVGGFSNAHASYSVHKQIENSEEEAYMQNLDNDKIVRLSTYGVDGNSFKNYYNAYLCLDYVINETGDDLYFAPKSAQEKRDLDGKYSSYFNAIKTAYKDFYVFDESYSAYKSADSAGGEVLTSWEEAQLSNLAPTVFLSMKNLATKAYELSDVNYNFVVKYCLGGSTYGNLKYTMLQAINGQTNVLFESIEAGQQTEINAYANYSTNAVQRYKNEKASNFSSELNTSSNQYAFKHMFYNLNNEELSNCYKSTNKQTYVNSLTESSYKTSLQKICTVMGWIS